MEKDIILVDEHDREIGSGEKMTVHREGLKHRAFSILIFNSRGEMMLQKRAASKYHGGGLWTNACCSHPRSGEEIITAAQRRLFEEMGFSCDLEKIMELSYKFTMPNGLIENEYDHVLLGFFDGEPELNPAEAQAWTWIKIEDLKKDLETSAANYTPWFKLIVEKLSNNNLFKK